MRRVQLTLPSPALGRDMHMLAFGHAGLPVLVFPSSEGAFHEYEDYWMIRWLSWLIDAGKLRLYCVSSDDAYSWYSKSAPLHERAYRHGLYESWVMNQAVPAIAHDVGGPPANVKLLATGCSFGAYHAANFTLKHPTRFNHALCLSGIYDIRFLLHGHHDDWVYFNNPMEYVTHLHGSALDTVRKNAHITLVCGQGQWEGPALASTKQFWHLLSQKGIPNYMDLWGFDVSHDWHWWREQIIWYMRHFVEGKVPWQSSTA